eukprot:90078_1
MTVETQSGYYHTIDGASKTETQDMDSSELLPYLVGNIKEFCEYYQKDKNKKLSIYAFETGHSNPPYLLNYGSKKYILRKCRNKQLLKGNISPKEKLLKQYNIISILYNNTNIPLP